MEGSLQGDGKNGYLITMIQYLKQDQIDKKRWDDCISRSLNRRIYGFSWYLDRVCPGWEAIANCDYTSVFPLTWNQKWGINYLFQPFFTQQSGLFSVNEISANDLSDFLSAISQRFRFAEIHLNRLNCFEIPGWEMKTRVNHELSLAKAYDQIVAGYSQNTRRNLKKAKEAGVVVGEPPAIHQLVELFRQNFGEKEAKLKQHNYNTVIELLNFLQENGMGKSAAVYSSPGQPDASAFFAQDDGRWYFLFAASSPRARENGAMFCLIDRFIAEHAGQPEMLDFEGGNDPQLGRFYKSFGATEEEYPFATMNRLPFPVKPGFGLLRKIGSR